MLRNELLCSCLYYKSTNLKMSTLEHKFLHDS